VVSSSSATSFLKLELHDAGGRLVSDNFYWIPARLSELDWAKSTYYYTPATAYADMRDLSQMPRVGVKAAAARQPSGEIRIKLSNTGNSVAFFVRLRAVQNISDQDLAPVFWDDNYVSLLPGESKWLTLRAAGLSGQAVKISIDGWNVSPQTLQVATSDAAAHPRVK
jgi:exo-1,4-beta-D-glucosaminidase